MIKQVIQIGPALNVKGGISSVLTSYRKLFSLPSRNFISSYNGSFIRSIPLLFWVCFKLLLGSHKGIRCYQIHTSSYGSFFRKYIISLCLRARKQKYIVHVHGSVFDRFCLSSPSWIQKLIRSYFRHAVCIVVLSGEMERFLKEFDPALKRFEIVPNPGEAIAEKPENLDTHKEPVKIVFSGRYGERKGVYDLIKAFEQAHFSVPVRLFLFGDGEIEKVKTAVGNSSQKEQIEVSPWLAHCEYLKKLPSFDLLVLPSYAERFSMSLVEALGFGLPVISTFVGGTAEVVQDGVTGILFNPGDIDALALALEKMVNHQPLRLKMGRAAWEHAQSQFTGKVVLKILERMYKDLF